MLCKGSILEYTAPFSHGPRSTRSPVAGSPEQSREELEAFAKVLDSPVHPVCAILGGAKAGAGRGEGGQEVGSWWRGLVEGWWRGGGGLVEGWRGGGWRGLGD